jgi:2-polyprenyl-3-methyl-5-hydroxy-6-metoxy-1,4-benzoquinol methylase
MELITKYNRAAPSWGSKMQKLGYVDAYSKFLNSQTLAHGPVLDAGTGTGAFAQAWVAQGGSTELSLLDPSNAMLDAAKANLRRQDVYPNIIKSRIEEHKALSPYSVVLAAHVIDHCDKPTAAFGNFYRWLEPRGKLYLVISRPHWCNWFIWLRYRHRWFNAADVLYMAQQAGFQHHQTYRFGSGPPSRTSLGYVFIKS